MSTEPDVKRSDILPIGTPFHPSPIAVWEVAIQDVLFFTPLP